jgi:hypothetical protein
MQLRKQRPQEQISWQQKTATAEASPVVYYLQGPLHLSGPNSVSFFFLLRVGTVFALIQFFFFMKAQC